ncbi:MAG: helix-turn-helix domain-containing protein [Pseudomonadota bacterium]
MMQILGQFTSVQAESLQTLLQALDLHDAPAVSPLPAAPIRVGLLLDKLVHARASQNLQTPLWEGMTTVRIANASFHIRDLAWTTHNGAPPIKLTEKERDILMSLSLAPDRALSREELLDQVWGYRADLDTHTLETHIYRLRHKIEADPATPQIIVTIPNGYKLVV